MRLRLEITRNRLPPTKILWQVEPEQTTAELLKSLDAVAPLESECWDLEDYVLETTDGFEALHYQTLGSILKDDDHVKIRPLGNRDIRARRISGRTQIHPSGAHLLDGAVYGRSFSYHVKRPQVHIAPREKLENGDAARYDASSQALILFDQDTQDDDAAASSNADDTNGDMVLDDDADDTWEESSASNSDHTSDTESRQDSSEALSDSSDDLEDNEVIPAGTIITVHGSKRPRSPDEVTPRASKRQIANLTTQETGPPKKRPRITEATADDKLRHSTRTVAPGLGRKKTKSRNKRRALASKLRHFKARGLLPADSNTADLLGLLENRLLGQQDTGESRTAMQDKRSEHVVSSESSQARTSHMDVTCESEEDSSEFGSNSSASDSSESDSDSSDSESDSSDSDSSSDSSENSRQHADLEINAEPPINNSKAAKNTDQAMASGSWSDEAPSTQSSNLVAPQSSAFEARRQRLLDQLASGGIDVTALEDDLARIPSHADTVQQSPSSRKLAERAEAVSAVSVETEDPLYWKSMIELTAVECSGQGKELSTPPFPFFQRWDPSQWNQNRKKKRQQQQQHHGSHQEDYGEYNGNGYGNGDSSYLNYDDVAEEDGAADDTHDVHDTNGFEGFSESEDDLPQPPEDLTSLPLVCFDDIECDDIMVFRHLEVSAATQWTPTMSSFRVAEIRNEKIHDKSSQLELRLAKRHLPPKNYDESGNRIFDKFEAPIEDEQDEGMLYLPFDQLVEPRWIVRGGSRTDADLVV